MTKKGLELFVVRRLGCVEPIHECLSKTVKLLNLTPYMLTAITKVKPFVGK